ncbi:Caspase family protein [uncultured Gammaproteobacteria bacterium]
MARPELRRSLGTLVWALVLGAMAPLAVPAAGLAADEPQTQPILRLETGQHTAMINRIDLDAAQRTLITAADDKTVRVWSLPEGRLVRVLRPPQGDGNEGKVFAAALSPDGNVVAAGGWMRLGEDNHSIYLFARTTGRVLRRLTGLGNVVLHITFSPDGRYLAASLASEGIRIWRTEDWRLMLSDRDYQGQTYGMSFARDGRLATVSYDGFVRLYAAPTKITGSQENPGGKPTKKAKLPNDHRGFSIAFSNDGGKIAVGHRDAQGVSVLSARDLALLFSPDASGINSGNISKVMWSADDSYLYAGGSWMQGGRSYIRRWSGGGHGQFVDLLASHNTIMDIKPYGRSGAVYGAADPAFGAYDDDGGTLLERGPDIGDFTSIDEGFRLSRDGGSVQVAMDKNGKDPFRFDLAERRLTFAPAADSSLTSPRWQSQTLRITDWRNNTGPKLNAAPIKLSQYETSRSFAIGPGDRNFVLGTDWALRRFDPSGRELWKQQVPEVVWGVNQPLNGRVAVAAYGDGTVRWHRINDGAEVLTLYVHPDRKRWVLWTPQGYYDASPNAEDLIGWHVNNSRQEAADFYPGSRFRDRFYRPDVIDLVLDTLDPVEAAKRADAEAGRRRPQQEDIRQTLPPSINILAPADGSMVPDGTLKLDYEVRSPSGQPITRVRVLLDGRPLDTTRGFARVQADPPPPATAGRSFITVPVPRREVEVSLIAETDQGVSEPARVHLKAPPLAAPVPVPAAPASPSPRTQVAAVPATTPATTPAVVDTGAGAGAGADLGKPKLYALVVGVSDYARPDMRLQFPAKDARDFATALKGQRGGLYRDVEVKLLTDREVTRDAVIDGLEWLRRQTTANDLAVLFQAGHGVNDNQNKFYFLPATADPDRLRTTAVAGSDVRETLQSIPGRVVAFLDTCHSGNVLGGSTRRGSSDINGLVNELTSAETGVVVFASSTGRQFSLERQEWGNGAFTKALIEGLSGRADLKKEGAIRLNALNYFIAERVKELTGGEQSPNMVRPDSIRDFPIATVTK